MPRIKVFPFNQEVAVDEGGNLRDALDQAGFAIKSTCGGCASCAQCVVIIKEGAENISDISFEEKQLLGNVFHITHERLSCQTLVNGDVSVDISIHTQKKDAPKTIRRSKEESEKIIEQRKEKAKEKSEKIKSGGKRRPKAFQTKE